MSRLLAPCGTPAAYQRHRRAEEPACDACKAAHTAAIVKLKHRRQDEPQARPSRARGTYKGGRKHTASEMDRLLEQNPPEIVWAKNSHGVWYAVEVHDPHAEATVQAQAERMRAWADRADHAAAAAEVEEARLRVVELMQIEADEVAERFRKHRAENTSLMSAARTVL